MKKTPRYYQDEAYTALAKAAVTPGSGINGFEIPYVNMATGTGKSLVSAMLTDKVLRQGGRVLQLVPTKELCQQNYEEAWHYVSAPEKLGICCAKLDRYQVDRQAVIATQTSFLRRAETSGKVNLCIIDECDLVSPEPETTYQKIVRALLSLNPAMKIVGLTATPYRMDQGMIHNDCLKGKALFTQQVYETDIPRLIQEGYLSHVESISGEVEADLTGVALSGQDYNVEQMGVKFDAIVVEAVADMKLKFAAYGIKTALIFASTLANARHILSEWGNDDLRIVYGDMPNGERHKVINWIKHNDGNRYIVNVGVLTTGFDYRALDCVALFRATKSLRLYVQMCGRVIRSHEEKELGYVLDYGSNIERHGPIDRTIPPQTKKKKGEAPTKPCLLCNTLNPISARKCKECEAEFVVDNETGLYQMRSKAQILAAKIEAETETIAIEGVVWAKSYSKKESLPMLKGLFYDDWGTLVHTHYICLDHPGYAGKKAQDFIVNLFKNVSDYYELGQAGVTVENLYYLLNNEEHYFYKITSITIRPQQNNTKFKELIGMELADVDTERTG